MFDPFTTTIGVRQGCVAAPNLFNVAVDYWVKNALAGMPDMGVNLHSRITDLGYADDVVVFAEFIDAISDALSALQEETTPLGLNKLDQDQTSISLRLFTTSTIATKHRKQPS